MSVIARMRVIPRYLVRSMVREISTTRCMQTPRSLVKLRKLQADFQIDDGRPIWLKGGFCDRILYTSTLVGCVVGIVMVVVTIYDYAKPQTWKTKTC